MYSQVTDAMHSRLPADKRAAKNLEFIRGLANVFVEYRVEDDHVQRVVRRCIETEFTGTSFQPLPDKGALIRIIQQINRESGGEAKPVIDDTPMRRMNDAEAVELFDQLRAKLGMPSTAEEKGVRK